MFYFIPKLFLPHYAHIWNVKMTTPVGTKYVGDDILLTSRDRKIFL